MLTDFQNFCTVGKRMKFATDSIRHYHLTLGTLLHYLGKLKMQIFCRCSAHTKIYNAHIVKQSKNTFDVAQNVLVFVWCRRWVGTSEFWREHEHWQWDDADADSVDDKPEPPGANPSRISLVNVRFCILYATPDRRYKVQTLKQPVIKKATRVLIFAFMTWWLSPVKGFWQ